jgi:hypothetical protein
VKAAAFVAGTPGIGVKREPRRLERPVVHHAAMLQSFATFSALIPASSQASLSGQAWNLMSSPPASQRFTSGANGRPPSGMNARNAARRPSMSRGPKRAN